MSFFSWKEKFSVGIDAIDREHQILVDLIDQLHEAFVNGNVHNTIGPVLSALVEYTHTHFHNEEAMMAENGYPFSAEHHAAHEDLRGQVEDIRKRFEAGDTSRLGNEMLAFLHDWLYFHILEEDMSYRPFFEAKGLAKPRPPGETAVQD